MESLQTRTIVGKWLRGHMDYIMLLNDPLPYLPPLTFHPLPHILSHSFHPLSLLLSSSSHPTLSSPLTLTLIL